ADPVDPRGSDTILRGPSDGNIQHWSCLTACKAGPPQIDRARPRHRLDVERRRTAITFPLHHGVNWHEGKPFTAEGVKCAWDLLMGMSQEKLSLNRRKSSKRFGYPRLLVRSPRKRSHSAAPSPCARRKSMISF